ncbi:hypothetical protein [Devosia sp.]|uniref:hypothetical protein n=1 Tax=Devosia sp. TaxID=1871048 RepID=UPI003BADA145
MIRLAAIALGLCGLATPSVATEWVNCADPQGLATFDFLVGSVDVLAIAGLNISVGEKVWASSAAYGPGEPVIVGQAYENDQMILIDAVDEAMSTHIAELRLFKAAEGDADAVYGGTLRIPGHGAWAVSCTGT